MVEEIKGDLFKSGGRIIGHGVNCYGVMGAGIAAKFRSKYPSMYSEYADFCRRGLLVPGGIHVWKEDDITIINLATQLAPGACAQYQYINKAMRAACLWIEKHGCGEFAIPRIGCGIGGLKWSYVIKDLEAINTHVPIIVYYE